MGRAAESPNLKWGFPSPGPQSPTGQKVMDHVFFLSEAEWKNARENGKYDIVIVGTGFCGYAVAHRARLSLAPKTAASKRAHRQLTNSEVLLTYPRNEGG